MSLSLGNTSIGSLYLGSTKVGEAYLGNVKVYASAPVPSGVPAKTMRFDFKYDHFNPTTGLTDKSSIGATWTHVENDVYDFHYENTDWTNGTDGLFTIYKTGSFVVSYPMAQHQFDILDMNLDGVTTVSRLFWSAPLVQNIASIRNTSSVTDFSYFIGGFTGVDPTYDIPSIPLFPTSSATNVNYMFARCRNVQSGALAMYQQMSSQATPPRSHTGCFTDCGVDTVTGMAELIQIPSSWGGTAT